MGITISNKKRTQTNVQLNSCDPKNTLHVASISAVVLFTNR